MKNKLGQLGLLLFTTVMSSSIALAVLDESAGEKLYGQHCAACHNGTVAKAPPKSLLQIMSASSILKAMDSGVMRSQAAAMEHSQRVQLAEYLSGHKVTERSPNREALACKAEIPAFNFAALPTMSGWGGKHSNQRYFSSQAAGLSAADMSNLEVKWAFAFPGAVRARSQPALAGGWLFVGSQDGTVYALDQKSGCVHWQFSTVAEVRTGIVISPWSKAKPSAPKLYFGDIVGNVYALNALTGELLWRDRPDDHPSLTITAAPALHEDKLYVSLSSLEVTEAADPNYVCCTFRGGVAVYDALQGEKLSVAYTIAETPTVVGKNSAGTDRVAPSGSPVWNTPALDPERGVMYVGTGENYSSPANGTSDAILALDLKSNRIVWQQQMTAGDAWNMGCETKDRVNCPPEDGPDFDFGAATILVKTSQGRSLVLAGQKSGEVFALDPDNRGAIVWRQKLGRGGIQGGVHFGMAVDGDTLYVPMSDFDGGARWPGDPSPGMFALDVNTGKVLWYTRSEDNCAGRDYCQPGLSAAASAIDGGVVGGGMDGMLRLYGKSDGKVLWEFDAATSFQALDGTAARGGSFGGAAGPVFNEGMMFVNSGYGIYFHMPGNVLLGFGPKDEP